jgi:toxin YoeB
VSGKRRRKRKPAPDPPLRKPHLADDFVSDLGWWEQHQFRVSEKLLRIMAETLADPFRGIGKPEPLKHEQQGLWSRRLTKADRVVYRVSGEYVYFISARSHYPKLR